MLPVRDIPAPPGNPADALGVRAYTVTLLLYGPARLSAAQRRVQLHKNAVVETEHSIRLRRSEILLRVNAELKASGAKSNEAERSAMVDAAAAQDLGLRELTERLRGCQDLVTQATEDVLYEDSRLAAAKSLARILGGSTE